MIDSRKPTAPSGAPELHDARSQGDAPSGSEVNGRDDDSPDGDSRRGGAPDGNESGMDLSSFRAKVDSYNGPLDLLLYLIKKDEIDLFDIPLARVVDQYRLYLDLLKESFPFDLPPYAAVVDNGKVLERIGIFEEPALGETLKQHGLVE